MAYVVYTGGKVVKYKHGHCNRTKREAQDQARGIKSMNRGVHVSVRKVKSCATAPRMLRTKRR